MSGRTLVGLRFWNQVRYSNQVEYYLLAHFQVDDDGESYWVFESRDVSCIHRLRISLTLTATLCEAITACQSY